MAAAILMAAAALAVSAAPIPQGELKGPFGAGADAVWMVVPRTVPSSIVVFLHGWKEAPPSAARPWVGQFAPWLGHLAEHGSIVVFPAYQVGGDEPGPARVRSLVRGLRLGFGQLHGLALPVVVAGYSYGASLAFYYAAGAHRWGLPQPRAVDAIFPAGPIPGVSLPPLGRSTRVLIEVGDRDAVAGRYGADWFWSWLGRRFAGRRRYVVVRSGRGLVADHAAPKLATPAARRAFWMPLDDLLAGSLRSASRRIR